VSYISVFEAPGESFYHRLKTACCILQIDTHPLRCGVDATKISIIVGVLAIVVACERVVESICFDDHFNGGVIGPLESEETSQEIFCALIDTCIRCSIPKDPKARTDLQHPILSCRPRYYLAINIVQLCILIVVEDTTLEEFLSAPRNKDFFAKFVLPSVQEG
jgi:hypothetical protein